MKMSCMHEKQNVINENIETEGVVCRRGQQPWCERAIFSYLSSVAVECTRRMKNVFCLPLNLFNSVIL